jgi:serine protease Do
MSRWRLVLILVVIAIVQQFLKDEDAPRRPPVQDAPRSTPVSPPRPGEPRPGIVIQGGPKQTDATGTAFAVAAAGPLLTAAHVTDGCSRVGILASERSRNARPASGVRTHRTADAALIEIEHRAPPLPLGDDRSLRRGDAGFSFGYPRARPGAVHGTLLARDTARRDDAGGTFPVLVWADVDRDPENDLPLSGLSGGPVLDAGGRVVGILIAGSERRGVFMSTTMAPVRDLLAEAGVAPAADAAAEPVPVNGFGRYGARLRDRLSVTFAVCQMVRGPSRRG